MFKPLLQPERLYTIKLPFAVQAKQGDALLIRHEELAGSRYLEGSSRLNGEPLADPKRFVTMIDGLQHSYLYWELPFAASGTLTYTLRHQDALADLPEPSLSLKVGSRELYLQGQVSFTETEKAEQLLLSARRDGLIRAPLAGSI